jgi:sugar fermentation stimulation protein A
MKGYNGLEIGIFVRKLNRFLAEIRLGKNISVAHIPNTGRLEELLFKGNRILLSKHDMTTRKTQWSIRYAEKKGEWISIDSQLPNALVEEALKENIIIELKDYSSIRREVTFGKSRFDFYLENDKGESCFLEVKGVTLEKNGVALFPDADTKRGIRHLKELGDAKSKGHRAVALFVIQLSQVQAFSPNPDNPSFYRAFDEALESGVECYAYIVRISSEEIKLDKRIEIAPQL